MTAGDIGSVLSAKSVSLISSSNVRDGPNDDGRGHRILKCQIGFTCFEQLGTDQMMMAGDTGPYIGFTSFEQLRTDQMMMAGDRGYRILKCRIGFTSFKQVKSQAIYMTDGSCLLRLSMLMFTRIDRPVVANIHYFVVNQ